MDWQSIVNNVVKEAMSAKWRDYALARLPEITGWKLQKPRGFGKGSDAVYTGTSPNGIPLKVTVDKMNGIWRVEGGGISIEDEITGLDQKSVAFALSEAGTALDQQIAERRGR